MTIKLITRMELFFLDLFIYVLSEYALCKYLLRVGYRLLNDRRFFLEFTAISFIFGFAGLAIGFWISTIAGKFF